MAVRLPDYFLKLLRRHSYSGAFSHPRHRGNVGAAGWAYLLEAYRDPANGSCFNWKAAIEQPFGSNQELPALRITSHTRRRLMDADFDVVIIGSGGGGAPIAHELVGSGHTVLVIEKGPLLQPQC